MIIAFRTIIIIKLFVRYSSHFSCHKSTASPLAVDRAGYLGELSTSRPGVVDRFRFPVRIPL